MTSVNIEGLISTHTQNNNKRKQTKNKKKNKKKNDKQTNKKTRSFRYLDALEKRR